MDGSEPKTLEVVLGVRNGSNYLAAFLDSLIAQNDQDFIFRVRNDGSTDATADILADYQSRFGERMSIEPDKKPTGTAKGNFAKLMESSTADYVLWADHDDVWLPNRISVTRRLLEEAEREFGNSTPIFAFTDVTPVDADLTPLADGYFDFKKIRPESTVRSLSRCLVCAPMLGCAAGANRALLDLAVPVPVDEVTGHDWWAFLLALSAGKVRFSRESTVLYRLHGANDSTPTAPAVSSYIGRGGKRAFVRRGMMLRWRQARAVRDRLDPVRDATAIGILEGFSDIETMAWPKRRWALTRGGYLYPDLIRTSAMLALS